MSVDACAKLVERGDPERFATVMAAPVPARAVLLPIYAFNLEVARAPWVTQEAMIAEMRLQWWHDVLGEIASGAEPRAHEVVAPLAGVLDPDGAAILQGLVEARRWDIYTEPHADETGFEAYLEDTAAGLMWVAARALGTPPGAEAAVRQVGWATGLAAYFRAIPALEGRGRKPLPDGRPGAVAALAEIGLTRLAAARATGIPNVAYPALWPGAQAKALLRQAAQTPQRVADGTLGISEFSRRAGLLRRSILGGW